MSLELYKSWKNRYDTTTPIRGRAVECKPWNRRNRDWEQVVRVLTPLGEGYGARLYNTDCVVVAPNGDLYIRIDGWATPLTADWIMCRSRLRCYKQYNKVWVDVDGRSIPLESNKPLHIKWNDETGKYTCDKQVVMEQKVVDKDKIKAVRHSVKELKSFVKVMMKLSDGWISNDLTEMHRVKTNEQQGYWSRWQYELMGNTFNQYEVRGDRMYVDCAKRLIKCMQEVQSDDDKVKLMLILAEGVGQEETRVVRTETFEHTWADGTTHQSVQEIRDYKYNPDAIVRRIDYIIKKGADVFTTKEVEVTKPMTNLVRK